MLTIAILSGIGYILSFINHLMNDKLDVSLILVTIFVLSTWSVLPLAITIIVITLLIGLGNVIINKND